MQPLLPVWVERTLFGDVYETEAGNTGRCAVVQDETLHSGQPLLPVCDE